MRLTSKGQVTIPVEIRRGRGLLPGMDVEFELDATLCESPRPAAQGRHAASVLSHGWSATTGTTTS